MDQPKIIVIAEDEKDLLNIIADVLTLEKFKVITATDGKAAFQLLQQAIKESGLEAIHAVVSDYKMPEVNGGEFLSNIRKEGYSSIPFVILSGALEKKNVDELIKLDVDGILYKPFDVKNLSKEIEKARKRRENKDIQKLLNPR